MDPNTLLEQTIVGIVVEAGGARSSAMEAIAKARQGDIPAAHKLMDQCAQNLSKAHESQTELIRTEARGQQVPITLMMIHAQDHLMCATVVRDLAQELIQLYDGMTK